MVGLSTLRPPQPSEELLSTPRQLGGVEGVGGVYYRQGEDFRGFSP